MFSAWRERAVLRLALAFARAFVGRLPAVLAACIVDLPFRRAAEEARLLPRARAAGESPRPFIDATILCSASSGMPCFWSSRLRASICSPRASKSISMPFARAELTNIIEMGVINKGSRARGRECNNK